MDDVQKTVLNGHENLNAHKSVHSGRTGELGKKNLKHKFSRYSVLICIFLVLIAGLILNSVYIYNKYMDAKQQYTTAFENISMISADKEAISEEKEKISEENNKIKEEYSKINSQNEEILKRIDEIQKSNEELLKKNRELTEDNIALQNSLKMAASVGIKPQNFTKFTGISSRGEIKRGDYLGKFTITAYTPSADECGNDKGITNSGEPIIPGISLAVDGKYWPFGTVFYIKGLGYAVAMDTGSAIKGKNRFDFAVFDKKFAQTLGVRKWDVHLVKMGDGKADKVVI